MALLFVSSRNPSARSEVQEVIAIIEEEPVAFILISRVFNTQRNVEVLDIVDAVIDSTLSSPRHALNQVLKSKLGDVLKRIYRSNKFREIKSEILEVIVYKYGPFTKELDRKMVYIEPIITHDGILIGNQSKIDSVFFIEEMKPLEFVECKTNIANVIPSNLPISKLNERDAKKVEYLKRAYTYLSQYFCTPFIYMACYNDNYNDQLENVHKNWGLTFFQFLNPQQLYGFICQKH
ncbi:hypothetical protein [Paenibacillus sp. YYML68]|uniref:hypothetical protein n=1 Tax=Paenibacillus sp. YYML68 TaxID=2909250 RepID=UPI00249333B3|nr:hypothetical protein [Paenibacillus sp. YYML68]